MKRGAAWVAAVAVTVLAARRLGPALRALLSGRPHAGLNLRQRYDEVNAWFLGAPVYEAMPTAVYPPGSMTLLWPWMAGGERAAFGAYVALTGLALGVASWAWAREAGHGAQRVAFASAPLAVLAVGAGVALGQVAVVAVVCAAAAVVLARRETLWGDGLAGLLFAFALVKPSVAGVFGWGLVVAGRGKAAVVAAVTYGVATAVSLVARPEAAMTLLEQWWFRATEGARVGAQGAGYGSVHDLVGWLGLPRGSVAATLVVLGLAGAWAWAARGRDVWVVLGVLGLAGRLVTYHRGYDDVLVLPAVLAGLRLGARGRVGPAVAAGCAWLALVAPVPPSVRVVSWLALLGCLLGAGRPAPAGAD